MAALNYIETVSDRIKVLLSRHAPTAQIKPANISQISDRRRRPTLTAKGSVQGATAFPSVEVRAGRTEDAAYGSPDANDSKADPTTIDLADNNHLNEITQDFEVVVTHDGLNDIAAALLDLEIVTAIRKGGRQFADPNTADSEMTYVVSWGPVTTTRERRRKQGDARQISTITVRTYIQLYTSELTT